MSGKSSKEDVCPAEDVETRERRASKNNELESLFREKTTCRALSRAEDYSVAGHVRRSLNRLVRKIVDENAVGKETPRLRWEDIIKKYVVALNLLT